VCVVVGWRIVGRATGVSWLFPTPEVKGVKIEQRKKLVYIGLLIRLSDCLIILDPIM
jgi:hypothetical protein